MSRIKFFLLISLINSYSVGTATPHDYQLDCYRVNDTETYQSCKEGILSEEKLWRFGSKQSLSEREQKLSKIYVELKKDLLENGYQNERLFRPSEFMLDEEYIGTPTDKVYELINRLPKGGLLHAHMSATHSLQKMPHLLFSLENCEICQDYEKGTYELSFMDESLSTNVNSSLQCRSCPPPGSTNYTSELSLLKTKLSMYDGHDYKNMTVQNIWVNFEAKFDPLDKAKETWHVMKALFNSTIYTLIEDNVLYAEFRTGFGDFVDKNGTVIPYEDALNFYAERIAEVRKEHPSFFGLNLILNKYRVGLTDAKLLQKLNLASKYYNTSKLVRGFDLVGYEEIGRTLASLKDVFLKWRSDSGSDMPFVFHAGETLWSGFPVDENVIDAVLLGTKRIGHGYALDVHPSVIWRLRRFGVGVELNPISNQVLGLVDDIRNHRNKQLMDIAYFNRPPLQFSVNSDDCLIFGTKAITDDLYVTILAMTDKESDLSVIKQVSYDSIATSLLDQSEKSELKKLFESEWNRVVKEMLNDTGSDYSDTETETSDTPIGLNDDPNGAQNETTSSAKETKNHIMLVAIPTLLCCAINSN